MIKNALCLTLILAGQTWTAVAAEPGRRAFQADDITAIADVDEPVLSRDGNWLAYAVTSNHLDADRRFSDLWMVAWDGSGRRNLTATDYRSEWQPAWSPDGEQLAFLADDPDGTDGVQVYVMPRGGGKARPLSSMPVAVSSFVWSPDGRYMVLVATDALPDGGLDKRGEARPRPPIVVDRYQLKDDTSGYFEGQRQRLYLLDVKTGSTRLLTPGDRDAWLPSWAPDSRRIAFVMKTNSKPGQDADRHLNYDVYVQGVDQGAAAFQVSTFAGADADPYLDSPPVWSPDGRQLAWTQLGEDRFGHSFYVPAQLVVRNLETGAVLTPGRIDRFFYQPRWSPDGKSLYALVEHPENTWLARVDLATDQIEYLTQGPRFAQRFDIAGNGRIALLEGNDVQPLALYAVEKTLRPLADHNTWVSGVSLRSAQDLLVPSFDGTEIHALWMIPEGADVNKPLPTLVRVHGGPVYQFSHEFMLDWQLYAAQGYAVLAVNPRGSSGRGFDFAAAIFGDWGNLDVRDVHAVVDYAVKQGMSDPARLGVGGWSYGGQLTDYLIAADQRFAAAVSGAGLGSSLGLYGVDQYVGLYEAELGTPWQNLETYLRISHPFFQADRIATPTLFQCAERDANVPCVGSEQMYQALRSRNIPTQLVVYPGENHGLTVPSYIRHRHRSSLEWFQKFIPTTNSRSPE